MSKGLGYLQHDILDFLDDRTEVKAGVYDLRLVARYVAVGSESADQVALPYYPDPAFTAAFSRAVRSLIKRGELVEVRHPLRKTGHEPKQTRFVRQRSS